VHSHCVSLDTRPRFVQTFLLDFRQSLWQSLCNKCRVDIYRIQVFNLNVAASPACPWICSWFCTVLLTTVVHSHKPSYRVGQKSKPIGSLHITSSILADFQNSFTVTFSRNFAIKKSLNIPPHLKRVATLPCEIFVSQNSVFCALRQSCWKVNSPESWLVAGSSCNFK